VKHPDTLNFDGYLASSYDAVSARLQDAEARLVQAGVRIPQNSRFAAYRRAIQQLIRIARDKEPSSPLDLNVLHQAIHEIDQIVVIVEELAQLPISPLILTRLQELVSGPYLPGRESTHTPARDTQFELYVAACCSKSGLPTRLAEPDVLVEFLGRTLAIAAKRPKSARKLESHIRKARAQIAAQGLDGLIALDLSHIHNASNLVLAVAKREDAVEAVRQVADSFVDRNSARLIRLSRSPQVFGLMVCVSARFFIRDIPQLSTSTRWTMINLCDSIDERYQVIRTFASEFSKAYDAPPAKLPSNSVHSAMGGAAVLDRRSGRSPGAPDAER
jgi:hypothetical protein